MVQNSTDFNVEPTIPVRGENPLIVIDGVAYANKKLNDIAAEDIQSISVLKGATASALYGFRGENGAILITTKNGSTGKTGVSVDLRPIPCLLQDFWQSLKNKACMVVVLL